MQVQEDQGKCGDFCDDHTDPASVTAKVPAEPARNVSLQEQEYRHRKFANHEQRISNVTFLSVKLTPSGLKSESNHKDAGEKHLADNTSKPKLCGIQTLSSNVCRKSGVNLEHNASLFTGDSCSNSRLKNERAPVVAQTTLPVHFFPFRLNQGSTTSPVRATRTASIDSVPGEQSLFHHHSMP